MKNIIINLLLAALSGILHAQGPLAPPAGPAPMMKSLDQVEPRTPISSLPYVISESGSYYFTGNLQFTAESGDAITINDSNVTLDLMGFTLSSTAAVTGHGIHVPNYSTRGITIHNGIIAGNTTVTVSGSPRTWTSTPAGFDYGIRDNSLHASIKDLTIRGCRKFGVFSHRTATIANVRAENNGSSGISAPVGSVTNSTASYNGGSGISASGGSVTNSTASFNGSFGISARDGSVTNSTASSNGVYDIFASNAVVAFCRFSTFSMTGSTRTGNFPSP